MLESDEGCAAQIPEMTDLEPGLADWAVLKGMTYADDLRPAPGLGVRGRLTDSFILQHPQLSGPV